MEIGNYHFRPHAVRIYALFTRLDFEVRFVIHHALFVVHKGFAVKPSPRSFAHAPFFTRGGEEVLSILHSPISENGPFAIQGERATSPFSILRHWEERGVTTHVTYFTC